jgi:hypothetical protein
MPAPLDVLHVGGVLADDGAENVDHSRLGEVRGERGGLEGGEHFFQRGVAVVVQRKRLGDVRAGVLVLLDGSSLNARRFWMPSWWPMKMSNRIGRRSRLA